MSNNILDTAVEIVESAAVVINEESAALDAVTVSVQTLDDVDADGEALRGSAEGAVLEFYGNVAKARALKISQAKIVKAIKAGLTEGKSSPFASDGGVNLVDVIAALIAKDGELPKASKDGTKSFVWRSNDSVVALSHSEVSLTALVKAAVQPSEATVRLLKQAGWNPRKQYGKTPALAAIDAADDKAGAIAGLIGLVDAYDAEAKRQKASAKAAPTAQSLLEKAAAFVEVAKIQVEDGNVGEVQTAANIVQGLLDTLEELKGHAALVTSPTTAPDPDAESEPVA